MGVGDKERLDEEVSLEFNGGAVDREAEDLEDPGDDLEEADLVAGTDDKGGGVGGIGVVNSYGGGGGGDGFAGGSSQQNSPVSDGERTGDGERGEVCERREWNWRELIRKWSEVRERNNGLHFGLGRKGLELAKW